MKHSMQIFGWLGSAWALAGCGAPVPVEENDESPVESRSDAVTTLPGSSGTALFNGTLDDGSTLEIRQSGGIVVLSGTTPLGVTRLDERYDLSVPITELFQQLFPGREVPEVLVQAELQDEEVRSNQAESQLAMEPAADEVMGQVGEPAAVVPKDAFHASFQAHNCSTDRVDSQPVVSHRHLNWCRLHWTGGFHSGTFLNKRHGYGAVQAYVGTVTARRSWRWTGASTWNVDNWSVSLGDGTAFWASATSGSDGAGIDFVFEVLNATGDSFHASGLYADRVTCFDTFVYNQLSPPHPFWGSCCTSTWTRCTNGTEHFSDCFSSC